MEDVYHLSISGSLRPLSEIEKLFDLNPESLRNLLQTCYGRRVDTTFDQTDKFD